VGIVCGRTTSTTPRDRLARLLDVDRVDTPALPLRWNVAPTQPVYAVIADRHGTRTLSSLRWGLVPHWAADMRIGSRLINARGETAAQRPAFRDAIRDRRTALVFDGFYEWRRLGAGEKGRAQPFYFYPTNGQPMAFAGLWDTWYDAEGRALSTCAIVTTAANATMAPVHHRMPVVLSSHTWDEWLRPVPLRPSRLDELLRPPPQDILRCHLVSTAVNSSRNEGPDLVASVPPAADATTVQLFSMDAPLRLPAV
jgi:putative SOS response-associated peptidase YedK